MDEVYVSFECTAKLYFRGPQRPVEHRCRLTLGSNRNQSVGSSSCVLTVEGNACLRRTFRITKENISNVAARLGDGSMTVVFRNSCCDSLVVKEVINRSALTLFHKIISGIWMGVGEPLSRGSTKNFNSPPGNLVVTEDKGDAGQSLSKSGNRKSQLSLGKRYGETRGGRMVEAAQSKPGTTSSFYKTDSCAVSSEPFLPQTPPTPSPYFQRAARRNLTFELSNERGSHRDGEGGTTGGTYLTPRDQSLGGREPRKAAVVARKRLPLGDIGEQTPSSATLRDCLILDESPNREGFANLGNTCYMNAVLQVLLGLEPFAEDLLNQQLIRKVNPQSLCRIMYLLLKSKRAKDSYDSQKILLKKIKSVIEMSRPKFSGYRQQDAHELLTQCLDQLKDDSKSIKVSTSVTDPSELSVCPVVRNFECEMCRSITCKSCGKVTEVREVIYDFALQLPKSVKLRANEQANLQELMDAFFVTEEVEYKCSVCSSNTATMSCRLARLPRLMILFLKRYGYNPNLSRNSKRIDFIRIPRFISVDHLCSEATQPPSEYQGPWPRDTTSSNTSSDNKENFPSSADASKQVSWGDYPSECTSVVDGDRGILGKRRSSEKLEDDVQNNYDILKKQKIEHVSISNSVTAYATEAVVSNPNRPSAGGTRVNTQVAPSRISSATDFSGLTNSHSVSTSNNSTITTLSGREGNGSTGEEKRAVPDCNYSQSSVGRGIAAEFDSLFSPEVIFEFENKPSFPTSDTAATTSSTTSVMAATDAVPLTAQAAMPLPVRTVASDSVTGSIATHTEHPLPHTQTTRSAEECLMLGLFGGVDCNKSSHNAHTATAGPENEATELPDNHEQSAGTDDEEEELKRAMEESMRDQQSSDVMLLGMSEDEQLKLALELSMQEQCPVEASSVLQPTETARMETPTPDTHQPETYKLVGIVNHIGKASSGGHYISDVCSVREGVWRSYNDCHVSEIREEDIRQKRQGTGYIFFYMHKSILGSISHDDDKRTT